MTRKLTKEQAERVRDYLEVFDSPAGRRVLDDLDKSLGGECYVRGDLYETLYRSFTRDIIVRIKAMLKLGGLEIEKEEENA